MIAVKICGLSDAISVAAALDGGAAYLGFVFFAKSPRNLSPAQAADLMRPVPKHIVKTGLFVDADDDFLQAVLSEAPLDLLQLHGKETPERAQEIKTRFKLPVMKALALKEPGDLLKTKTYEGVADRLLFDAPPPKGALRPGGNALSFDWTLLKGKSFALPWMLAGGLTPDNLKEAVAASGATAVDVSSGVEDTPGRKSPALIRAFLKAAEAL